MAKTKLKKKSEIEETLADVQDEMEESPEQSLEAHDHDFGPKAFEGHDENHSQHPKFHKFKDQKGSN